MKVIVNGQSLTPQEYAAWSQGRLQRLQSAGASLEDALREQTCCAIETDATMLARCYSSESPWRRRQIALAAKRAGKCEEQAYDPTMADCVLDPNAMFEGRGDRQRRIDHEIRRNNDRSEPKPVYRLHPRLVREVAQKMAEKDPDVLRRDRRELVEEITAKHGSKG